MIQVQAFRKFSGVSFLKHGYAQQKRKINTDRFSQNFGEKVPAFGTARRT